ncbi:hypothetical protein BpHYR1_034736 [Brachionus plicatilis]|uniref:Uncharacterized protein n=1 Tax=Brachionus plicatilis TaxID=10195 RepID=A0A3M7SBJ5_BRAPC|nr:hypothetical protein BpHYR1_034736 [Brachionus plicatilis]
MFTILLLIDCCNNLCQLSRRKSFQALENSDPSKMFPQNEKFHLKLYLIESAEHLMLVFTVFLCQNFSKEDSTSNTMRVIF